MTSIKESVSSVMPQVILIRRDLHRIPELAFQEFKTAQYITDCLLKENLDIQTSIAKTGVMGILKTSSAGPVLLIRADMDALPITEETGLPFASTHNGVMHACGHDSHMAMAIGSAIVLNRMKDRLKGTIKFIFQPAEEKPGGAKPMIDEGVLENPKVDYAVGCHVWPALPEGTIGIRSGNLMAAMGYFTLRVFGKGGHGAIPHQCVDPLEVGTQVVSALQRITSRKINPLIPAVLSICSFHSGNTHNVIPESAELLGTARTFDRSLWNTFEDSIRTVVKGVCDSMGATFTLDYTKGYPPLVNDSKMTDVVRKAALRVVPQEKIMEPELSMGSEDMAYFLERSKGCFFYIGVGRENGVSVHNPRFSFNEELLSNGIETFCHVALDLLGR